MLLRSKFLMPVKDICVSFDSYSGVPLFYYSVSIILPQFSRHTVILQFSNFAAILERPWREIVLNQR